MKLGLRSTVTGLDVNDFQPVPAVARDSQVFVYEAFAERLPAGDNTALTFCRTNSTVAELPDGQVGWTPINTLRLHSDGTAHIDKYTELTPAWAPGTPVAVYRCRRMYHALFFKDERTGVTALLQAAPIDTMRIRHCGYLGIVSHHPLGVGVA